MGHSAGAAIASAMMLIEEFMVDSLKVRIQGLILQGGVYHYRTGAPVPPSAAAYYETDEGRQVNVPLALLERAPKEVIDGLPPNIILFRSEWEPKEIGTANTDFANTLSAKLGHQLRLNVMKGHNHTSPHFSLFLGEGDDWAYEVARWVKGKSQSHL